MERGKLVLTSALQHFQVRFCDGSIDDECLVQFYVCNFWQHKYCHCPIDFDKLNIKIVTILRVSSSILLKECENVEERFDI